MSDTVQVLADDNPLAVDASRYHMIDDKTRTLTQPEDENEKILGVETDKDAVRRYFKCPKIVGDNIDLTQCQLYVGYIGAKDEKGKLFFDEEPGRYHCDDVSEDGDYLLFSWKLSGNVFLRDGYVAYNIYAVSNNGDETEMVWNTTPAIGKVLKTVPKGTDIVERFPDVINQLFERLLALETKIGTGGGTSFSGNAADVTYDNTNSGLDADNAQEAIDKLSKEIDDLSIPTKTSQLDNDSGFLTSLPTHNHDDRYFTETEANNKFQPKGNYLTEHQDISGKLDKNQGSANVGKILVVGTDGNLTLTDMPEGGASGDIIGTLDASNNILLSGNLADGTYVLKYENTDGTFTEIGNLTVGKAGITNLADPTDATWIQNGRVGSDGTDRTDAVGKDLTNYISVTNGDVVRVKNFDIQTGFASGLYNASKGIVKSQALNLMTDYLTNINLSGEIETFTINHDDVKFVRLCGISSLTDVDVIITVNEEIA